MSDQFVYPIQQLKQGPIEVELELTSDWLNQSLADADVLPSGDARGMVRCSLELVGRDVLLHGHVQARVFVACARCLKPTLIETSAPFALHLQPSSERRRIDVSTGGKHGKGREPEYEFTAEEAMTDWYDGERIVLDEFIREAIVLELPTFPLCSETCEGIDGGSEVAAERKGFEQEATIDPRLAPLLKWKKQT